MKIAILITARLKSIRLPMKVIKPIMGKPMIIHLLDRLKLAQRPQQIIICTSPLAQDDPLEKITIQESILCFRGHPDDVLLRLTHAAEQFGVDTIISCTADNPFVDPIYIDRLIDFHMTEGNDYSNIEGLPFGTFSYALSYPAMVRACQIKAETNTEVWGGYFAQTGLFKTGTLSVVDPQVRDPDLRLTVDTPEDFELVTAIFNELYQPGEVFPLSDIVDLCRHRPNLVAINADVQQKPALPIKIKSKLD